MDCHERLLTFVTGISFLGFFSILACVLTGLTQSADQWMSLHIQAWWSPAVTQAMLWVTDLGRPLVLGGIAVAIGIILLVRKRWFAAIPALVGVASGAFLVLPIKELIHRPRPETGLLTVSGYSFPSDHATVALLFFGFLLCLLIPRWKPGALRWLLIGLSIAGIVLISFTRLYLDVHWLSDVLGGWLLGLGWLSASLLLADVLQTRRSHNKES